MQDRNGRPPATEDTPGWWQRADVGATLATVVALTLAGVILVSAISYQHEYELARHNEQARWVSSLLPFSVDGVMFVAAIALLWASMNGVRGWDRLWQPRGILAVGAAATIAANFFSDRLYWWLGPAVSASSGVSLVLMSAVAFWLAAEQRKVRGGDTGQRDVNCSCPPPPTSLAEALPGAVAELRRQGRRHGQETLATRFGTTVHQVRAAKAAVAAKAAGDSPAGAAPVAPAGAELQPVTPGVNGSGSRG